MLIEARHASLSYFSITIQVCTLEGVNVCRWLHIWCLNAERNVTFRIVWSWKEFPFFLHHLKATLSGASRRFPLVGSECACAWLSSSEAKSGFYPGGLHQRNENKKVKGSFGGVNHQCQRSFLHDFTAVVGVILHFRLRRKQKPSRKCLLIPKRMNKRVPRHTFVLLENTQIASV